MRPPSRHKISRYKTEGSTLSDEEWESTLTSLLLGTEPAAHLHVAAQFTDENLGIEIGNRVSGATNIAGTLVLRPSKSATKNADMFAWADEAVMRQTQLAKELAQLKLKHAELHELVTKETANVKALVRSKEEFESEHDSFFRDLLNEKKLKIRAQEQILSTAHVDEAKLATLNAKAKPGKPEAVGSSRKGKRKAESLGDETNDDEDGIDKMDVDEQSISPAQELSDVEQTTDEETASEPEPEPKSKNPTRSTGGKKAGEGSSPSASKPATKSNRPPSSNLRGKSAAVASGNEDEEMPAPRALPFGKAKPVPDPADDESTASES
ncbi:hypothetical protein UCDDA912_g02679 [Diaporthe ampelina]|uniref:Uncharacterized protein n=1 Tax=Diaporthe ampelina TaxID=1214573 RepID=A0A0G2FTU4_9PEZI|nr:hypothetical protein UCDDA912_g02679 [Diaporthe ampelina]